MSGLALSAGGGMLAALAGVVLGWIHFRSLHTVAERLLEGRLSAVALQLIRFAVLAAFLFICARLGSVPLLAAAAGVMAGRTIVLRRAGRRAG
jgi:hypothetical protein